MDVLANPQVRCTHRGQARVMGALNPTKVPQLALSSEHQRAARENMLQARLATNAGGIAAATCSASVRPPCVQRNATRVHPNVSGCFSAASSPLYCGIKASNAPARTMPPQRERGAPSAVSAEAAAAVLALWKQAMQPFTASDLRFGLISSALLALRSAAARSERGLATGSGGAVAAGNSATL